MQIVRTLFWVIVLFALLAFSFFNWKPVEVQIWSNLVLETKLPALVIISFLLGLVPMWLLHRANKWRMQRRIAALESATTRLSTPAPKPAEPVRPTHPPAPAADPLVTDPVADPAPPYGDRPAEPASPIDPEPTRPQ